MIEIREDDRVLLLSIPAHDAIDALARQLEHGLLVALGAEEAVRSARRALSNLENVMFVAAPPHDIPWQGGFFTRLIDCRCEWENPARVLAEIARVLAPDGLALIERELGELPPFLERVESPTEFVLRRRLPGPTGP